MALLSKTGNTLAAIALMAFLNLPAQAEPAETSIRVTLLGTGTPAMRPYRSGPSTLVVAGEEVLLFDAGRGTTTRIHQAGVPFAKVDKLFLTHLHSDHITGVPDLFLSGWLLGRRTNPLRVWGPEGSQSFITHLEGAFEYDIWLRSNMHTMRDEFPKIPTAGIGTDVSEITEGVVYRNNGVTVTAFEVDHSPIEPAFGFRIDYEGHSVVISGDTIYSENLIKHAQGVDLLVHEVAYGSPEELRNPFRKALVEYHTSPADAGRVFAKTQPRLAVFTHVITSDPEDDSLLLPLAAECYSGEVVLGQDLMTIDVGDEITVVDRAALAKR